MKSGKNVARQKKQGLVTGDYYNIKGIMDDYDTFYNDYNGARGRRNNKNSKSHRRNIMRPPPGLRGARRRHVIT